jgi:hypothetical protein
MCLAFSRETRVHIQYLTEVLGEMFVAADRILNA